MSPSSSVRPGAQSISVSFTSPQNQQFSLFTPSLAALTSYSRAVLVMFSFPDFYRDTLLGKSHTTPVESDGLLQKKKNQVGCLQNAIPSSDVASSANAEASESRPSAPPTPGVHGFLTHQPPRSDVLWKNDDRDWVIVVSGIQEWQRPTMEASGFVRSRRLIQQSNERPACEQWMPSSS